MSIMSGFDRYYTVTTKDSKTYFLERNLKKATNTYLWLLDELKSDPDNWVEFSIEIADFWNPEPESRIFRD